MGIVDDGDVPEMVGGKLGLEFRGRVDLGASVDWE